MIGPRRSVEPGVRSGTDPTTSERWRTLPHRPEHSRTVTNTTNPHSRALPNVTEHIPRVTNFSQGVQTQPSWQTDIPETSALRIPPWLRSRGRGVAQISPEAGHWPRPRLTYGRTTQTEGQRALGKGPDSTTHYVRTTTNSGKYMYIPNFRNDLVNCDASTRWPVYDRSDRQACAHTHSRTPLAFSLTSHTHTHTHFAHHAHWHQHIQPIVITLTLLLSVPFFYIYWINLLLFLLFKFL